MLRFPSVAAPVTWPGRAEQGGQGSAEPLGLPESSAPRGCPFPEPSQPWQGPAGPGGHLGLAQGTAARARLRGAGAAPVDPGRLVQPGCPGAASPQLQQAWESPCAMGLGRPCPVSWAVWVELAKYRGWLQSVWCRWEGQCHCPTCMTCLVCVPS